MVSHTDTLVNVKSGRASFNNINGQLFIVLERPSSILLSEPFLTSSRISFRSHKLTSLFRRFDLSILFGLSLQCCPANRLSLSPW